MFLLPERSELALIALLLVLWVVPRAEGWISKLRNPRIYEIVCSVGEERMEEIERLFFVSGLDVKKGGRIRSGDDMISQWKAHGKPEGHKRLVVMLFAHPDVKGFQMQVA